MTALKLVLCLVGLVGVCVVMVVLALTMDVFGSQACNAVSGMSERGTSAEHQAG